MSIDPGEIVLTVIPSTASAFEVAFANVMSPALAAEYGTISAGGSNASSLVVTTIRPCGERRRCGTPARTKRTADMRL